MSQTRARRLEIIDPSHIDTGPDAPLRFRRHLPGENNECKADGELTHSIRRCGILQPPLLMGDVQTAPDSVLVIQGHRRLAAARAAELPTIEALVLSEGTLAKQELAACWLEEATSGKPLSELEQILLTRKCATFVGDTYTELLPYLSRAVGRRLSPGFIEQTWKLLTLDEATLELFHRGAVSTGDLFILSGHEVIETSEAVRLLSGEKLNRREQKEAVRLMIRIGDRGREKWERFTAGYRAGSRPLLDALHETCYPTLSHDMEAIEAVVREIGLPPGAGIQPPQNLEGGSYRLTVRIRDERILAGTLQKLHNALAKGAIARLLRILKGE